ncbi:hypothetical protein Bbelb_269970 [Branchiostoma belcheri]|nr:hypothetical protein Bbelb_269970 [Branchiostoma belcheri]
MVRHLLAHGVIVGLGSGTFPNGHTQQAGCQHIGCRTHRTLSSVNGSCRGVVCHCWTWAGMGRHHPRRQLHRHPMTSPLEHPNGAKSPAVRSGLTPGTKIGQGPKILTGVPAGGKDRSGTTQPGVSGGLAPGTKIGQGPKTLTGVPVAGTRQRSERDNSAGCQRRPGTRHKDRTGPEDTDRRAGGRHPAKIGAGQLSRVGTTQPGVSGGLAPGTKIGQGPKTQTGVPAGGKDRSGTTQPGVSGGLAPGTKIGQGPKTQTGVPAGGKDRSGTTQPGVSGGLAPGTKIGQGPKTLTGVPAGGTRQRSERDNSAGCQRRPGTRHKDRTGPEDPDRRAGGRHPAKIGAGQLSRIGQGPKTQTGVPAGGKDRSGTTQPGVSGGLAPGTKIGQGPKTLTGVPVAGTRQRSERDNSAGCQRRPGTRHKDRTGPEDTDRRAGGRHSAKIGAGQLSRIGQGPKTLTGVPAGGTRQRSERDNSAGCQRRPGTRHKDRTGPEDTDRRAGGRHPAKIGAGQLSRAPGKDRSGTTQPGVSGGLAPGTKIGQGPKTLTGVPAGGTRQRSERDNSAGCQRRPGTRHKDRTGPEDTDRRAGGRHPAKIGAGQLSRVSAAAWHPAQRSDRARRPRPASRREAPGKDRRQLNLTGTRTHSPPRGHSDVLLGKKGGDTPPPVRARPDERVSPSPGHSRLAPRAPCVAHPSPATRGPLRRTGNSPSRWKTPHEGDGGPAPASASRGLGAGAAVDCLSSVRQRAPHARGYNSGDPKAPGTFRGDVAAVEPVAALRPEEVQRVRTPRRRPIARGLAACRRPSQSLPGREARLSGRQSDGGDAPGRVGVARRNSPRSARARRRQPEKQSGSDASVSAGGNCENLTFGGRSSNRSHAAARSFDGPPDARRGAHTCGRAHDAIEGETDPQPDVAPGRTRGRRRQKCRPSVKDGERAEGLGVAPRTGTRREDRCAPHLGEWSNQSRPVASRRRPRAVLTLCPKEALDRGTPARSPTLKDRSLVRKTACIESETATPRRGCRGGAVSPRPRRETKLDPIPRKPTTRDAPPPGYRRPHLRSPAQDFSPGGPDSVLDRATRGGWLAGSACVVGNDGRNGVCAPDKTFQGGCRVPPPSGSAWALLALRLRCCLPEKGRSGTPRARDPLLATVSTTHSTSGRRVPDPASGGGPLSAARPSGAGSRAARVRRCRKAGTRRRAGREPSGA